MSYNATGTGNIVLHKNADLDAVGKILWRFGFENVIYPDSTPPEVDLWHYEHYNDHETIQMFEEMIPYASKMGMDFQGEDGRMWTIYLDNGHVISEDLDPVPSGTYNHLLRCSEALKKVLNTLCENVFEVNGSLSDFAKLLRSYGLLGDDMSRLGFDFLFDIESPSSDAPNQIDATSCKNTEDVDADEVNEDIGWLLSQEGGDLV